MTHGPGAFQTAVSLLRLGMSDTVCGPFQRYKPPALLQLSQADFQSRRLWGLIFLVQIPGLGRPLTPRGGPCVCDPSAAWGPGHWALHPVCLPCPPWCCFFFTCLAVEELSARLQLVLRGLPLQPWPWSVRSGRRWAQGAPALPSGASPPATLCPPYALG